LYKIGEGDFMASDKLTCPYCERSFGLDEVENAELWRERAELAAALGACWKLANEYAECFRAEIGARMTIKKRVRILGRVAKLWQGQVFEYKGKKYRIKEAEILKALHTVCSMDKTGFKDDNYLKVVMAKQAERLSEEGLTAKEEAKREKTRGQRSEVRSQQEEEEMTLREWREKEGMQSLGELFGKTKEGGNEL